MTPSAAPRRAAVLIVPAGGRPYPGANHPLAIPRVSLTLDVITAYGALADGERVCAHPPATAELCRFHSGDYVQALQRAQAVGRVGAADRRRHQIGTLENPVFPGVFAAAACATGGSLQGAQAVLAGHHAFNPAGGMHHAAPDQARGFCYFNDPVLAIMALRDAHRRVLYVDIDAHHGDGVEAAFDDDPAVMTVSLHMDTRYAYPFRGGRVDDQGRPPAQGTVLNAPLPRGTHDTDYLTVLDHILKPLRDRFVPDVIVLQAGTDTLFADPLGRFDLSTAGFLAAVERVIDLGLPVLVTGGGGYHPVLVARAWTGVWAILSGRTLPVALPAAAAAALRAAGWDEDEDEPYYERLFQDRLEYQEPRPLAPSVADLLRALDDHPLLRRRLWAC